jgi:uncharacterized protein YrrD
MAHLDSLGREHVSDHVSHDARDVRGAVVRGPDGTTLGEVVDVIFDHDTMEISYLVVDSGGWLEAGSFLLPACEARSSVLRDCAPGYPRRAGPS